MATEGAPAGEPAAAPAGSSLSRTAALAARVAEVAGRRKRSDLVEHAHGLETQLRNHTARVVVLGEFKQGKSSLVNALIRDFVCPVDDDVATVVPTAVRWGPERWAQLLPEVGPSGVQATEEVPVEALADYVAEQGNPGNHRRLRTVDVSVPSPLLGQGLTLVDMPGAGGLWSTYANDALAALPFAAAAVFVTDASQELSAPELEFLRRAAAAAPRLIVVLTKIDLYPWWRKILEIDREHLLHLEADAPVVGTSSTLLEDGARSGDEGLLAESGFGELQDRLREVVLDAQAAASVSAAGALQSIVSQLEAAVLAEREAADPERARGVVSELRQAQRRASRLVGVAAGWRTALDDAIGDLRSDVEDDVQQRARALRREIDEAVSSSDPARAWEEFSLWLTQRVVNEFGSTQSMLSEGARRVGEEVAELFSAAEFGVTVLDATETTPLAVEALADSSRAREASLTAGDKGMVLLSGAWGSMEALGFLGGLVGVGLLNPLALIAGVLTGRKALRNEHRRQLDARRQRARELAHDYLEEAQYSLGRELRDGIRRVHHQLRDAFMVRAEEVERSIGDALLAAERVAAVDPVSARLQCVELDTVLVELQVLGRDLTRSAGSA